MKLVSSTIPIALIQLEKKILPKKQPILIMGLELVIPFVEEFLNLIKNLNIVITGTSRGVGLNSQKNC